MGSLRLGFLVVCDCLHRTGKFKFLLILVVLFPFGFAFARMVAAPACKGEAKRKQGNKDEKKIKFASAMETVAHDEESESE